MNLLNFNQPGGFPLSTNILDQMQKAYSIFNALAAVTGNFAIISGCELVGQNVSNGVVSINGEVLEFRGGQIQTHVVIATDTTSLQFEDQNIKQVIVERYVRFGTGVESYAWEDFARIFPTKGLGEILEQKALQSTVESFEERLELLELQNAVFQESGAMVLWNKPANQIPQGWREVVDWRGRMPVGWDPGEQEFSQLGATGGAKEKTLSIDEMPEHYHHTPNSVFKSFAALAADYGNNSSTRALDGTSADNEMAIGNLGNNYDTPNGEALENSVGGGESFSLLNPYRVVMFIEFIGL